MTRSEKQMLKAGLLFIFGLGLLFVTVVTLLGG